MVDQNLKNYIKNKRDQGLIDGEIKQKLLSVGWSENLINQAILEDDEIPLPNHSESIPAPKYNREELPAGNFWDAFEHIVMFISLYIFSTALALILHYMVDKYLSQTALDSYNSYRSSSMDDEYITSCLSAIIVAFPIFLYLFRKITNRTLKNPLLRKNRSRKLLTYMTLIGTFIILVVQAITTVYSFLNGNITFNFLAHFAVTCSISGAIFGYYFSEVKEDRKQLNII
jgi:hypothetical protein